MRDGRDVVVSKYFFEKEFCVKNAILKEFSIPFDDYVEKRPPNGVISLKHGGQGMYSHADTKTCSRIPCLS